eukprot:681996-Alexandrium_andersonii.AAC.1
MIFGPSDVLTHPCHERRVARARSMAITPAQLDPFESFRTILLRSKYQSLDSTDASGGKSLCHVFAFLQSNENNVVPSRRVRGP